MGYFTDVKLDVSAAKPPLTGYVLTVLVSEKPAVREVKVEGNEELSKDDFKDTIEVKPFQILDQEAVRKSAKKMQEKYVEKGNRAASTAMLKRSEEHTSELQSPDHLVCRLLLEKKKNHPPNIPRTRRP